MKYIQLLVGVVLGAVVAFAILWLYDRNRFADPIPAYALAVVVGGVVTFLWVPLIDWLGGWRRGPAD
jgi:hypothetical protein